MGPRLFSRGKACDLENNCAGSYCFNGAAAVQPRKAPVDGTLDTAPCCFNGAAAVQPRKGFPTRPVDGWIYGFNGAAAVQPRKVTEFGLGGVVIMLQWGRGCSAAESSPSPSRLMP